MNGNSKTSNRRSFRGLDIDILAAMVIAIASSSEGRAVLAGEDVEWTEMYVPYGLDGTHIDVDSLAESFPFTSDEFNRQHLHLFQSPSDKPTPVYFYSHFGGGIAEEPGLSLDSIASTGYSVISWESVTHFKNQRDVETCWSDFELVWSWFEDNANFYNFDPNKVVIGGRSRGTMCSWMMAHSEDKPAIKGIYMYNVLPDPAWLQDSQNGSSTFWEEAITTNSPRTHLLFQQECPKPIQQDCVASPDQGDIHNPRHGQTLVDRYTELGIESRIRLTDGMANKGIGIFDLFPEFVASLSSDQLLSSSDLQENPVSRSLLIESFITFAMAVSLYVIVATIGFNHCKERQSDRKKKELCVEDPAECDKLVMDDGEVSLQDMGKTSYRDEADQLPDIT